MILATAHSQISETKHLDVTIIKDDRSWRTPVTLTLASWAIGQSDPKFQHFAFKGGRADLVVNSLIRVLIPRPLAQRQKLVRQKSSDNLILNAKCKI